MIHWFGILRAFLFSFDITERILDGQAETAATAPTLIGLGIIFADRSIHELTGIEEVTAIERKRPITDSLAETEVDAPTGLTRTLSALLLRGIPAGGLESELPRELHISHNAEIPSERILALIGEFSHTTGESRHLIGPCRDMVVIKINRSGQVEPPGEELILTDDFDTGIETFGGISPSGIKHLILEITEAIHHIRSLVEISRD